MEEYITYLSEDLSKIDNVEGKPCWSMSLDKYHQIMIKNIEYTLKKKTYKLHILGILINSLANRNYDNEVLYKNIVVLESTLKEK